MSKNDRIAAISNASTHTDLDAIVSAYLAELGESENARGESYAETSARLGGDEILDAAERRWFEL
jgi:hypothetical protein